MNIWYLYDFFQLCIINSFFFFFFEKQHCNFIQRELNRFELQKLGVEEHPSSIQ